MIEPKKARLEIEHEDEVARVILCSPKGNIVDQAMMGDLERIFDDLAERRDLKAVVFSGDGATSSFGASVQEHLPSRLPGRWPNCMPYSDSLWTCLHRPLLRCAGAASVAGWNWRWRAT